MWEDDPIPRIEFPADGSIVAVIGLGDAQRRRLKQPFRFRVVREYAVSHWYLDAHGARLRAPDGVYPDVFDREARDIRSTYDYDIVLVGRRDQRPHRLRLWGRWSQSLLLDIGTRLSLAERQGWESSRVVFALTTEETDEGSVPRVEVVAAVGAPTAQDRAILEHLRHPYVWRWNHRRARWDLEIAPRRARRLAGAQAR